VDEATVLGQQHGRILGCSWVVHDPSHLTPTTARDSVQRKLSSNCVSSISVPKPEASPNSRSEFCELRSRKLLRENSLACASGGRSVMLNQVLGHQRVDHVFQHAHEVGIETGKAIGIAARLTEECAHVGVVFGQEFRVPASAWRCKLATSPCVLRRT